MNDSDKIQESENSKKNNSGIFWSLGENQCKLEQGM